MKRFLVLFVLVGCAHAEIATVETTPAEPTAVEAATAEPATAETATATLTPPKLTPGKLMAGKLVSVKRAPAESEPADSTVPIVPGELLIITSDQAAIETSVLAEAVGRDDFTVRSTQCLTSRICRVVVERRDAPADEAWTREFIDALSQSRAPGIVSVEGNAIVRPLEEQEVQP